MADDKEGREKRAHDEDRRQRGRELEEAVDRAGEAEPPRDDPGNALGDFDAVLTDHTCPPTGKDPIEVYSGRGFQSQDGQTSIDEALAPVADETYNSADEVRARLQELLYRS